MNYCVYDGEKPDGDLLYYFKTEPEAADFVHKLIAEATKEVDESGYPHWLYEVQILQVQASVVDDYFGGGPIIVWHS